MSQEQALHFLQQGIAAAKAGRKEEARPLLQNAIRLDPGNETAWLWLSSIAKDQQERIFCLRQILEINPANEMAVKGLKALGVAVSTESGQAAAPARSAVPIPTAEKISAARKALPPILNGLQAQDDPLSNVKWVRKRRNRAGERAAILFSIAIRVVPLLLIAGLVALAVWFVTENPGAIALAPTWTPSFTPTATATPTPGFTPTPSATPRIPATPTPPIPDGLPRGDLFANMTITPAYPRFFEGRVIQEAVMLIDAGQDSVALPTLSALRETLLDTSDTANPYYYEAIALTNLGDTERAERLLNEGLERMAQAQENPGLLQAGLAYVFAARGSYADSNAQAELALQSDPELPQPYYTLIRNLIARENYQDANLRLTEALDRHPADVNLWILEGRLNLARGQAAQAQQDARIALYIDPAAEEAYLLQAEADLALGDYGLAALHLQDYLFTYPGSIQGWTLLGDTRLREGNPDLALAAYGRALNTGTLEPVQIPALLARADLFAGRAEYDRAYADYARALTIDGEHSAARLGRAESAYRLGRYSEAIEDVDILLDEEPTRADLRLLKARALVDGANPNQEEAFRRAQTAALNLLAGDFPDRLQGSARAAAYEYRARIQLDQDAYSGALGDITRALEIEETGSRHYLRGQIHEARREVDAARREYEWVRLWSQVYPYPFAADAVTRLEALSD